MGVLFWGGGNLATLMVLVGGANRVFTVRGCQAASTGVPVKLYPSYRGFM